MRCLMDPANLLGMQPAWLPNDRPLPPEGRRQLFAVCDIDRSCLWLRGSILLEPPVPSRCGVSCPVGAPKPGRDRQVFVA